MREHAVPQQISSYEFRLVGDMTLKQFFQLAGGVIVALVFYGSGLPGLVKWPLVLLFAFAGIALAFLPLEERPLSVWISAFIKAVYSPTQYRFVEGAAEKVFAETGPEAEILAPGGRKKAEHYLASIPVPKALSAFEEAEKKFFQKITALFQGEPAPQPRPAYSQQDYNGEVAVQVSGIPRVEELKDEDETESQPQVQPQPIQQVPEAPPVEVQHTHWVQPQPQPAQIAYTPEAVAPVLLGQQPGQAAPATFAQQAAPPSPPSQPNTVFGQVLDSESKIVEGAILEMKDTEGRPVRALKTNKLGHFMAVTPLSNGEYSLEIEKDGFTFDVIKFAAKGEIIQPIEIRARSANSDSDRG